LIRPVRRPAVPGLNFVWLIHMSFVFWVSPARQERCRSERADGMPQGGATQQVSTSGPIQGRFRLTMPESGHSTTDRAISRRNPFYQLWNAARAGFPPGSGRRICDETRAWRGFLLLQWGRRCESTLAMSAMPGVARAVRGLGAFRLNLKAIHRYRAAPGKS
jgi:hypothetical protein